MKRTREEWAARRAEIARDYRHGAMTQEAVGRVYGITAARVGQIVKRVAEDERKARCARGEHGEPVRSQYVITVVSPVNGTTELRTVPVVRCADCGEEIRP